MTEEHKDLLAQAKSALPRGWSGGLTDWYSRVRRPLPWRDRPEPFWVWVGEVMSQQTSLQIAALRFSRLIAELPNASALAACAEPRLRALWSGLGYYARARNLQRGAQQLMSEGTHLPETYADWLRVPGVGPYTAAVVASMSFGERVPSVDGNATRVVSRLLALSEGAHSRAGQQAIRAALEAELAVVARPGDFNQAVMELGQRVCKKSRPLCTQCPVEPYCRASARGIADSCPGPRPRPQQVELELDVLIVSSANQVLLALRQEGFLKGTIGFPLLVRSEKRALEMRAAWSRVLAGQPIESGAEFLHFITCHRIKGRSLVWPLANKARRLLAAMSPELKLGQIEWARPDEVEEQLAASLDRKAWHIARHAGVWRA